MAHRIIAIGDIHGCSVALKTLLAEIRPGPDDTLVSLGDVVDRGPQSRECVELLMATQDQCNFVLILGNHEEMMLNVVKQNAPPHEWLKHGGVATLDSYGFSGDLSVIPQDHLQFLESGRPYFQTAKHFFVHGNYDPPVPLEDQSRIALRWRSLTELTPGPHVSGKKAVVGHTPDQSGEIFDIGHLMCIDTYCYGGAWLTATDVTSGTIWQANQEGQLRA